MSKTTLINGESLSASLEITLAVEQFLKENYLFRRNVLNGKVELATKQASKNGENAEEETPDNWRPLTQEAEIMEFVHSEDVPTHNPISHYLSNLPKWDGQNHIAQLFSRLPGITSEQQGFLATWLRSAVAHWLQMDTLHGNECVPVLIGAQGCGKTTFYHRLLPPELREYYLDHLNLSNKFDKEMALTNNLLVNLDELEAIRPSPLEKQGERPPHLWSLAGRQASLCLLRGYHEQSSPFDRPNG